MGEVHVNGAHYNAVGKTKKVVGHAVGSKKLETEGKIDQQK